MSVSIPTEINKTAPTELTIKWDDDHVSLFPTRYLRCQCVCAGCVSEITGERILDEATVPDDVTVTGAENVGRYGVMFQFSDGHSDGIYTWAKLRAMCPCCK